MSDADSDIQEAVVYRKFIVLVSLLLVVVAAAGCGNDDKPSSQTLSTAFPLKVPLTDGQTLTLDRPAERIVSLSPHATETLCAIGAGDRLVAVDRFANCPAGSKAKPEVDSFQPNLEAIAAYKPDLVYVFSDQGGIVAALRRLNIPVLYLALPGSLDGTFENISLIGRISGHDEAAKNLADSLRKRVDAVKSKVAGVTKGPRVFHEVDSTLYTVGPDTFVGELYRLLKAENIAAGAAGAYPQLSAETVVARDPEVVILADDQSAAQVRARPGWSSISAVKSNRICTVDPSALSQPGPRIADGLEALFRCLYPDR